MLGPPVNYTDIGTSKDLISKGIFTPNSRDYGPGGLSSDDMWATMMFNPAEKAEVGTMFSKEQRTSLAQQVVGKEKDKYSELEKNQAQDYLKRTDPLTSYNERFAAEVKAANEGLDKFTTSNPVDSNFSEAGKLGLPPVPEVQDAPQAPEGISSAAPPSINTALPNVAQPELVNQAQQGKKRRQTSRSLTLLGTASDTMGGATIGSKSLLGA